MTSPQRFEQDLPALLAGTYLAGIPDYRDDLVRQIAAVRQRPAWTFPGRWLPMDLVTQRVPTPRVPWRAVGVLALIALLLASLVAAYVGSQPRLPTPFGLAANGIIVSSELGDIVVRDALDGPSRVLIGGPANDIALGFSPLGDRLLVGRLAPDRPDRSVGRRPEWQRLATGRRPLHVDVARGLVARWPTPRDQPHGPGGQRGHDRPGRWER